MGSRISVCRVNSSGIERAGACTTSRFPMHEAGHGIGQEADEATRVAGLHRHADLAVGLEAADAGTVARAGVDHDETPLQRIDVDAFGRNDFVRVRS